MTGHAPRRWFLATLVLVLLTGTPAAALPIEFTIFDTNTLVDLGTFTVDPTLANPSGQSSVEVSAFSISETLGSYGLVTVTLADRLPTVNGPYARFVDGQITGFSSNTQYQLPGIAVNVDIVPQASGDLNFVGVFQMWAATSPNLSNMVVGPSRGIGIKSVPEPSTMFLMTVGAGAAALFRRRRRNTSPEA